MNSYYEITRRFVSGIWRHTRFRLRMIAKPATVVLDGIVLAVRPEYSPAIKSVLYRDRYERDEARCLLTTLTAQDVVMEIGAGIGFISSLCAKRIGSDRVFSYEANPDLIPLIQATYQANQVNPQITKAIVDSQDGQRSFYVESDFTNSAVVQRSAGAREVCVHCLDVRSEMARVKPTFLIMDVEGGEGDLVPIIDFNSIQKIVIETHERLIGEEKTNQVRAHLTKSGFTVNIKLSTQDVLFLERLTLLNP